MLFSFDFHDSFAISSRPRSFWARLGSEWAAQGIHSWYVHRFDVWRYEGFDSERGGNVEKPPGALAMSTMVRLSPPLCESCRNTAGVKTHLKCHWYSSNLPFEKPVSKGRTSFRTVFGVPKVAGVTVRLSEPHSAAPRSGLTSIGAMGWAKG